MHQYRPCQSSDLRSYGTTTVSRRMTNVRHSRKLHIKVSTELFTIWTVRLVQIYACFSYLFRPDPPKVDFFIVCIIFCRLAEEDGRRRRFRNLHYQRKRSEVIYENVRLDRRAKHFSSKIQSNLLAEKKHTLLEFVNTST